MTSVSNLGAVNNKPDIKYDPLEGYSIDGSEGELAAAHVMDILEADTDKVKLNTNNLDASLLRLGYQQVDKKAKIHKYKKWGRIIGTIVGIATAAIIIVVSGGTLTPVAVAWAAGCATAGGKLGEYVGYLAADSQELKDDEYVEIT